jgi:imidazolonepropionase-like amidohydrolase
VKRAAWWWLAWAIAAAATVAADRVAPAALFPHVAVGGGYSTSFSLVNTGRTAAAGTLILTSADGTPLTVRFSARGACGNTGPLTGASLPLAIPPGGSCFLAASAVDPGTPARSGWARVESYGASLGGAATFTQSRDGRVLSSAGVLSADPVESVVLPVDDDRTRNRYTGFAVANPGAEQILIRASLTGSGGPYTNVIRLGPASQMARYFYQDAPIPESFKGSAVLSADGGGKFSAVALVQDSGLFSAIPTLPIPPAPHSVIALVNGTVIDGTGAEPRPNAVVLIHDDHIAAIGSPAEIAIPASARVIDVAGATVLPGFINSHVHSAFIESSLRAWAQAGVTTVRDLGFQTPHMWWPIAFRNARASRPEFARIVTVGVPITPPGGYPQVDGKTVVLTAATPDEARARTNQVLDNGADLIKACLESGAFRYGAATLPLFTREQATAIIDTAHRRGVPVSVHVTAAADLALAVEYGFDEIAHMAGDYVDDDDLIARMVAADIDWVPTLELLSLFDVIRTPRANLRRFVAAGGKVALGTDYMGAEKTFQLGMPMREIELMQDAGMTPMQIIVAATKNAAHVCNLDRTLGTLEKGKAADVLVVNGNPLADLHALTNVRHVLHSGTLIR